MKNDNKNAGKNARDEFETVELKSRYWLHFDWLESQNVDMKTFIEQAVLDNDRSDLSLSEILEFYLLKDEVERRQRGEDVPLHIQSDRTTN